MEDVRDVGVGVVAAGVCSDVFLEGHGEEVPLAVVDVRRQVHGGLRVVTEGPVVDPGPAVDPRTKPGNSKHISSNTAILGLKISSLYLVRYLSSLYPLISYNYMNSL